MYKITLLDRLIINSISKGNGEVSSINKDSDINEEIIYIVLQDLIVKNIVVFMNSKYQINSNISPEQVKEINNTIDLQNEKILISKSLIRKQGHFNLKRFALNSKDQILFEGMLKNINLFLENNQIQNQLTKEENLFVFGFGNYTEIVKDTIY